MKIYQNLLLKNYDQSQENYDVNKEIRIKTSMLRPDLCDFSDAYFVVKGTITATKKTFTANDFRAPNNTADNANAIMLRMIMCLVKRSWFLKTMLHLSTVFQKLMV